MSQEKELERKRKAYQKSREEAGEKYESQIDQALRRSGTRTFSVRVKIETIVAVYDCMVEFGGDSKGRGIGSNIVNVLTACMESMQRDGLLPKRTNEEIAARYEEISGTKLIKPLINVPLNLTQEVSTHSISAAVSQQILESKPKEAEDNNIELYETSEFSIGDIPEEKPLEDRIFERENDTLVQEVSVSENEDARSALIKTYKTIPESLWGSSSARTLYNANLKKES